MRGCITPEPDLIALRMPHDACRVLVLDDDGDLREMLCEIFLSLGADDCLPLASVSSLQAAPRALNTELAVVDVNLGDGVPNGVDAFHWLCDKGYRGRIVFLTGHARSFPPVAQAAKHAAAQILQKPTSIDTLKNILDGCNHASEDQAAP